MLGTSCPTPLPISPPIRSSSALIYFSFSTLTTSSFGDILPVHPIARSLANLEAVSGQFVNLRRSLETVA